MREPFLLHEVRYVKRIVIGRHGAARIGEAEITAAVELLNRCLNDSPKGRIIGLDKGVSVHVMEDGSQVILQNTTYHVGWTRKPAWLSDLEAAPAQTL